MLLPRLGPALLGMDAYSRPSAELYRRSFVGNGRYVVNASEFDVPPPGAGLLTVTTSFPSDWMSAALTAVVSVKLLTYVVARFTPFHCTTDVGTKLEPEIVSVNAALPAAAELGCRYDNVGTGLGVTLIVVEFDTEGPGFVTVIVKVPTDVRSAAGIVAEMKFEFQPFTVMLEPFIWTVEKEMKPEP